jgi:uncharacterized protein (TIGR02266 family)
MSALPESLSPDAANRRIAPRIRVAVEIHVRSEHRFWIGLTENLSEGGLFVATAEPLEVGDRFDVLLSLDGVEVHAPVEVRWVRPPGRPGLTPGVGVRLLHLPEGVLHHLQTWVREHRDDTLFVDFD